MAEVLRIEPEIWEAHLPPLSTEEVDEEIEEALTTLAKIVQVLDVPDASFMSYSTAIENLSTQHFALGRSLNRLNNMAEELKDYLESLKHERDLLKHWNEALIPGPSSEIGLDAASTLERRKEALVKKAKEQHRELEALLVEDKLDIRVSVGKLIAQKEKNLARENELKEKRAKIKAFQGLPPVRKPTYHAVDSQLRPMQNLELARHELRAAREKQMELIQLRERLLGRMADGVS
ncbi:hypothetical protein NLJ89_g261 [Agrocybe chaxingu]|uniref:Uncharacterized protein n=1 Tax=Agrocybe chaxingu TaxID=84603 RepID=A0A9W8N283_9AGAR|nr:hypothetical protein NLJ89_g261 [Agrocybe chaxingu]